MPCVATNLSFKMDFSSFNSGGIDFSPYPCVTRITLVLDEPELRAADYQQFSRFWDVWQLNRHLYAPKLTDLTLVLRPGMTGGTMNLQGINAFLDHYRIHIEPLCETKGLNVYLDSYSALSGYTRYQVLEKPILLITTDNLPGPAAGAWPAVASPYDALQTASVSAS
jgi:hypothetical protein